MGTTDPFAWSDEIEAAWMLTLRDLPPASCMRTTHGVKIAAQAQWQQRERDEEALVIYAKRWHEVGWSPFKWWQLAASLTMTRALEPRWFKREQRIDAPRVQYPREFALDIHPSDWAEWPALAAEHGSLRATLILLSRVDLPRDSAIFWATKPVRISELTHLPGVKFHWLDASEHTWKTSEQKAQIISTDPLDDDLDEGRPSGSRQSPNLPR
jgi:hypothetical protein